MADGPSKADISSIFKRLRSIPTNKQCFDCGHSHPTWASVTYGVFLCIDCSAVHRSLGVHITFIRSTQLDVNWTWLQLRAMQVGGNANATAYFRQHGCDTTDAQKKYHSRAAHLYREKLLASAQQACRLHGTKLFWDEKDPHGKGKVHIESSHHEPTSPQDSKEVDFFKEHTEMENKFDIPLSNESKLSSQPQPIKNGSLNHTEGEESGEGPSVEAALSMSPTQAQASAEPRKTLIGAKKPASAKKGKRLGAQKVKTDFSEIENRAAALDKEREELAKTMAAQEARTQEEQEKQMATMRLAYQDMSLQRKKQEEKLKAEDPKKAAQFERLGMGFAGNKGISHSAISDMQTIQQETPTSQSRYDRNDRFDRPSRNRDFFEDELDVMSGFSSKSSSRFGDNSYGSRSRDDFGSWGNSNRDGTWDMDRFESKTSGYSDTLSSKRDDDRPNRSRKAPDLSIERSSSDSAQKRFPNAKSISSDQFFGNRDTEFEVRQNLSRLDGRSGISSDDLFGTGGQRSQRDNYNNTPDLQDIKDGVKQGVTKVAGKISSLANGVITSLQDRYS